MPSLITGASGFLGGRLAQILIEAGDEVQVLARHGADLRHLPEGKFGVVRGSLADAGALASGVRGATHIYHCAACSTDWAPDATYRAANVEGTANLIAAARKASHLQRFVHVSTTDVYGYPEVPCGEDHPCVDAGLPYNQTKGLAEATVWEAARTDGLPVTVVRPATIYGPRGKDFTQEIATMLRQRMMATIDRGSARGGFIYVDDVAEAMIAVAGKPAAVGQAYNLCDASGTTWAGYLRSFAEQLGTREPWIDLPFSAAMKVAAGMEGLHRTLRLRGRPLLTRHAVILLGRDQEFPVGKARAEFGFAPRVTVEEGIRRSVGWLSDTHAPKR